MRAEKKCPGLREQSQGHKDKITAISLAKTGGKVNGKLEPIEAQDVGSSMMCYTLGKANSTCLGERQLRGRIGKSLYLR